MPPNDPVPAGSGGIHFKEAQLQNDLSKPLTPDEMWQQAVQSQRGFLSSPSGPADAYRKLPATVPKGPGGVVGDPKGVGPPVGKGYETFAAVQVLGKDGRRVALGADFFDGGGLENHGEARSIRGLERSGPANVAGGRMIIVTEKDLCQSCETRVLEYARQRGIKDIEVYVPSRASMTNPGALVTPKQAARTAFQGERPPTRIQRLRTIEVPGAEQVPELPGTNARTAVAGAIANLAAGVLLNIFQQKFKEKMLKDLENMPKPKVDRRAAKEYLTDPKTVNAVQVIDLFNKGLSEFTRQLSDHHQKLIVEANAELMLLALSSMATGARLEFLSGLSDQLHIYLTDLTTVQDNVGAARQLEPKALDGAQSAEDLAKLIGKGAVTEWLFDQGFSVDEIVSIWDNLSMYASRVRKVFQDFRALDETVKNCLSAAEDMTSNVDKLYRQILWQRIAEELKSRGVKPQ